MTFQQNRWQFRMKNHLNHQLESICVLTEMNRSTMERNNLSETVNYVRVMLTSFSIQFVASIDLIVSNIEDLSETEMAVFFVEPNRNSNRSVEMNNRRIFLRSISMEFDEDFYPRGLLLTVECSSIVANSSTVERQSN